MGEADCAEAKVVGHTVHEHDPGVRSSNWERRDQVQGGSCDNSIEFQIAEFRQLPLGMKQRLILW